MELLFNNLLSALSLDFSHQLISNELPVCGTKLTVKFG